MKAKIIWIKVVIAAFLLIYLIKSGQIDFSLLTISASIKFHVTGLTLVTICLLIQVFRWWMLMKLQGFSLSIRYALWLSWVGFFISLPLPGMAGGILSRAYLIAKDVSSQDRVRAIYTVVFDRAIGLFALLCMGAGALCYAVIQHGWDWRLESIWLSIVILFSAILIFFTMLCSGKLRQLAIRFLPTSLGEPLGVIVGACRHHMLIVTIALFISLLSGTVTMGAFMVAGGSIGEKVSWNETFQVVPLVFVAGTLPIAPDGIGVSESAASLLFSQYGIASGATIMLIYRLWMLLIRLPGSLLFIFCKVKPAAS